MRDESIRNCITAYAEENGFEDGVVLFDNHAYDKSIIGLTEDGRAIYDEDKMIQELMDDEGWSEEDAIEWLDYNTYRAIPYAGERAPIITHSMNSLKERYGEITKK